MKTLFYYAATCMALLASTHTLKAETSKMSFKEQTSIHDEENNSSSLDSIKMTEEEQEQTIEILSLYAIPIDSSKLQRIKGNAQAVSKITSKTDFDTSFFAENISHLDSVVHYGIELAQQNKGGKLLDLLEKERLNFYAHPNNTIDNEIALHQLFIELYAKFYKGKGDVWQKVIPLVEFSKTHILSIQTLQGYIHPYYPRILYNLIDAYLTVDDIEKAIITAKELDNCYQDLNDIPDAIVILLRDLYGKAGMRTLQDSCLKILEASPIYQDFMKTLQQEKQQSTE